MRPGPPRTLMEGWARSPPRARCRGPEGERVCWKAPDPPLPHRSAQRRERLKAKGHFGFSHGIEGRAAASVGHVLGPKPQASQEELRR
jgi:hypothetical protein